MSDKLTQYANNNGTEQKKLGNYNSVRHECLTTRVRGSCVPDFLERLDSMVSIERTEDSRKPDKFRKIIDTLYPVGARLEMFEREAHEGWALMERWRMIS